MQHWGLRADAKQNALNCSWNCRVEGLGVVHQFGGNHAMLSSAFKIGQRRLFALFFKFVGANHHPNTARVIIGSNPGVQFV